MQNIARIARASCVIASLFAITPRAAAAPDELCQPPAPFAARDIGAMRAPLSRVRDYRPVFQQCRNPAFQSRLAIRRMRIDGAGFLLTVDPETLATHVEPEQCWTCADTSEEAQKGTRFVRAVQTYAQPAAGSTAPHTPYLRNAGLIHGEGEGAYITGDLCPSPRPLDRDFLERLAQLGPRTPVALSISGVWLTHHGEDFQWLKEQARSGALEITWVNHSFHHPYFVGQPFDNNFLLSPGVDLQGEVLDTEKLLIANGETPSIFFRFPGLISNPALMETLRADHLVPLGADGWMVFAPPLRPGAIILVHPNGNEPAGLRLFSKRLDASTLPRPFRSLNDAPLKGAPDSGQTSGACPADPGCPRQSEATRRN